MGSLRTLASAGTLMLLLAAIVLSPGVGWAQGGSASPGSGLSGSAHDFTQGGVVPATPPPPLTDIGLCTLCHTPHKAQTTGLLWNHTLSQNNFHWDIPATTAGTPFPTFAGPTYKGPTTKCLSCHDGSVAIGNIAWFAESPQVLSTNPATHSSGEFNIGPGGNLAGNHPVAMPYPFNGTPNTYNGVTNGGPTPANIIPAEWQADPTALASAVSRIRLFNDDGTGNVSAGPIAGRTGLECSSCHDPHNKQAVDDLFLRGKLSGNTQASGYICLQCHVK
jgi:hypothetical protein